MRPLAELVPRWTVYPALATLAVFSLTAVPGPSRDPNAGAALEARARAGVATPGEVVPSLAAIDTSPATPPASAPRGSAAPPPPPAAVKRVVVLGIDGLDPELLQETIERYPDRMRNFARLIEEQGLHSLGTSTPPQSPVAWSNFITGLDPGGHGIYDFIHRDPTTRQPVSSATVVEDSGALHLPGEWKIPLGGDSPSNRTGESFWVTLARNGVPADVWRMPANFPVEPARGLSFPGMMTPALDSAYGSYTLYSSDPPVEMERTGGKYVQVKAYGGVIQTDISGPPNAFKEHDPAVRAPLTIYVDDEHGAAAVDTGRDVVVLSPGEWSAFVQVDFPMLPAGMMTISGSVRFYLRSLTPEFELYASPVNIDPEAPATPVSQPADASEALASAIGLYYTQGMAEEVNALKDEVLSDEEFMRQVQLVYDERRQMLDYALEHYLTEQPGGLFFFYFSTVDLASHMMWRFFDQEHPQHRLIADLAEQDSAWWSGREGSRWKEVIYDLYMRIDPVLGQLRESVGEDATLIVMSDHGFETYTRKFSLNTWLLEEGYLVLKPGKEREREGGAKVYIWDAVDWSKTRAYGMGFNGLYLNLAGREQDDPATPEDESGIVPAGERRALLEELKRKLEGLTDPGTGRRVVLRADIAEDVYAAGGGRLAEAPDIQVGYDASYGNADAASTGRITAEVYADNMGGTFNGNHLMAPDVVAGTLLSNRPVRPGAHALEDLTVEILRQYGIQPLPGQRGHPVLE